MYPDNHASKFRNVLKKPIKLDPNVEFQTRLANFHIPNVEYIKKKKIFKVQILNIILDFSNMTSRVIAT